jgi:hypothetical protein
MLVSLLVKEHPGEVIKYRDIIKKGKRMGIQEEVLDKLLPDVLTEFRKAKALKKKHNRREWLCCWHVPVTAKFRG